MSKQPSPKADALRAMREQRFKSAKLPAQSVPDLRRAVAAIPVKRAPRKKKEAT